MRMAFFNLTHLGPQDPFRNASGNHDCLEAMEKKTVGKTPSEGEVTQDTPNLREEECNNPQQSVPRNQQRGGQEGEGKSDLAGEASPATHTARMYSPSADVPWHRGSHTKYTELLRKHQRNPKGSFDF